MFCLFRQKYASLLVIFAFFLIFILSKGIAVANALSEDPKKIPWNISAGTVTFNSKKNLYIAQDAVAVTGVKTRLEADYVEFSNMTKDAFAQGNVILISGEDSISCNSMKINLTTEIGVIYNGVIFVQKNNFYVHGETIRKTGKFSYDADKGSVTSCKGDSPDWKITGKEIKVTIEGYGVAKDVVLWAKKVPAAYSPFLVFPVHTKRQTGLLSPRITSSDRKGIEYEQPLFIALSRNTDATIYTDHMSDRGTKLATEYRYVIDNKTKGSLFLDVLEDEKTDDGTSKTEDYSFSSTPQRTNSDRYWFRMKHNQAFANGFTAKLDIDIASDADYLQEFKNGFTGYSQTNKYFEKEFGRGLDEYDDTTRENRLNIYKSWDSHTLDIDAFWYDNIIARRQDTDDTTLQTFPAIQFDAARQQISDSMFYYSLDTEMRSFYRKDTADAVEATDTEDAVDALVNGQRLDIYPKIYLPLKLGKFFSFEPSIGVRQTLWRTDEYTDINGNSDSLRTREMYDIGAELSTKITKIFNPDNSFADKIKHELIPKLEYNFTPDIDQDDLPVFDSLDRIEEQNIITWSLTNTFISKQTNLNPEGEEKIKYREFAYLRLYQSYDIEKDKESESEPFSDIFLNMELNTNRFISLDMDVSWSPYANNFQTFNIGSSLRDSRGDVLETKYRYTRDESESLYSKISVSLTDELTAYCSIEKNLKQEENIEKQAGFTLNKSCWSVNLHYSDSQDEKSLTFLITLHGIGGFGTK